MLAKGYLANNSVYVSTAHTKHIIMKYLRILDQIFKTIRQCELGKKDIKKLLKGPVNRQGFVRLN